MKGKPLTPKKVILAALSAAVLLLLVAVFIFPLFYMVSTSLKTLQESNISPPTLLPEAAHPENYREAWQKMNFWHYLRNSVVTTALTVGGQLAVCVPCAYAFAKKEFRFKKVLFPVLLFDLAVPAQVVFLSYYLIESRLNWLNTLRGLTVPFMYSAFTIFFLTQHFRTVPDEILDAARMDKSSELQIITRIMVPIAKPVVISAMLFTFVYKWNDYFWASILTTNEAVRTIPLAIQNLMPVDHGAPLWHIIMAGNVMLFAPMFLTCIFASKYIKRGFLYGGVQ